jgi:hypothetical protein
LLTLDKVYVVRVCVRPGKIISPAIQKGQKNVNQCRVRILYLQPGSKI